MPTEYILIPLSRGQFAVIDVEDASLILAHKWYCASNGYACRRPGSTNSKHTIYMHRVIANAPEGIGVDHRDRNTLNNRRYNLRLANQSQNNANRPTTAASGFRGVRKASGTQDRWIAQITVSNRRIHLGRFDSPEAAARAYDAAARDRFGEFATVNFIEEGHLPDPSTYTPPK